MPSIQINPKPKDVLGAHPFPSVRQKGCAGLKRQFYPASIQDLVDYDYEASLPEDAKVWLAAFSEEHYRGWRLKKETQVTRLEHLREADAGLKRVLRGADGMAVKRGTIEPLRAPSNDYAVSPETLENNEGRLELRLLAGARGVAADELRSRNEVEDKLNAELDEDRDRARRRSGS